MQIYFFGKVGGENGEMQEICNEGWMGRWDANILKVIRLFSHPYTSIVVVIAYNLFSC